MSQEQKKLGKEQRPLNTLQQEDVPANSAGAGDVAGLGTGSQGEPGVSTSLVKRKTFAGHDVFEVNSEWFHKARFGKKKYARYEDYVGNDEIGEAIRQYGREDYGRPIVIQDERTGAMCYLRYGKK